MSLAGNSGINMAPDICNKCYRHRGELKSNDCDHEPRICPHCKEPEKGIPIDARYCQFCDHLMKSDLVINE